MLKLLDLFSGIGGFSLAAQWVGGIQTIAFCEIDPFCQQVLKKHWPEVPIYPDIKELRGGYIGTIDIICGGFPCPPFSTAGRSYTKGRDDDRYLWPEMFRIIQECRPTWVIGENVANFARMELDNALADMEGEDYETQTFIIPAFSVGAKHQRERVWFICHTRGKSSDQASQPALPFESGGKTWGDYRTVDWQALSRPDWAENPSRILRMADGLPSDVDRRKALGNSIVPQIAYQFLKAIVEIERGDTH